MSERPVVINPFGGRPSLLAHGHECANGRECPRATCRRGWVCESMWCNGQHLRFSSIALCRCRPASAAVEGEVMEQLFARMIPRSPQELLDAAALLDAHRRFVERCGCAWPSLAEMNPALVISTLAELRRGRQPLVIRSAR